MLLKNVMIKDVKTCRVWDTLNTPAQLMWDHACGCIPVLDENSRVVGIITDRDICMAAYTQGRTLRDMQVRSAMSKQVESCRPLDTLAMAEEVMKSNKIRRLPVVDVEGRLVGIVSLDDIAREAVRQREAMVRDISEAEVGRTLAGICEASLARPRKPRAAADSLPV
jgi:CBS-domain-containing membrane protein